MTENIMLQETEMTKTGFCDDCDAQSDELKQCKECGGWACPECYVVCRCDNCYWAKGEDELEDDDE